MHLVDVFARPGFVGNVGKILSAREAGAGLRFLEVSYGYRGSDPEFLARVPAAELVGLVGPELVTCAFNLSAAVVTDDPDDPTNLEDDGAEGDTQAKKEGMMPLNRTHSAALVEALVQGSRKPMGLLLLDVTLYTVSLVPRVCMSDSVGKVVLRTAETGDASYMN